MPALVSWETANVIPRLEVAGIVSADQAVQAHRDLLDLAIELWPYALLAARAWDLRQNLSIYDASYAALAELLQISLVTLDQRLAGAPGLACAILLPRAGGAGSAAQLEPLRRGRRAITPSPAA